MTSASSASTASPTSGSDSAHPADQPGRVVTLPTGDRVRVSVGVDGRPRAGLLPRRGDRDVVYSFRLGSDLYVVPRRAAGEAQRDLASFNVTALAGLSTPTPPTVHPQFPMHTLTLKGIDNRGRPDTGDLIVLVNVDNMRKYNELLLFDRGIAKVSVPAGHYSAFGYFFANRGGLRGVMLPQFTVDKDRSVTVDARAATTRVTITTPRPARSVAQSVTLARGDRRGQVAEFDAGGFESSSAVHVQPVARAPRVGELYYAVYQRAFSRAAVEPAYSYDLEFPSVGTIPADQRFVVADRDLARADATYTSTRKRQLALDARFAALPWQTLVFADFLQMRTPLQRQEYYTARPDVSWQGDLVTVLRLPSLDLLGEYLGAARTYRPGETSATRWGNGQPITPVLEEGQLFPGLTICPACADGRRLHLFVFPFGDADQHFGYPDFFAAKGLDESVRYGVYADGVLVDRGRSMLDTTVRLPRGTQRYRIAYNVVRRSAEFTQSTSVRTSWSLPADAEGGAPPADWACSSQWKPPETCTVLPLMTSRYELGADALGRLQPGHHVATVAIGHLHGATGVDVNRLQAKLSFDDGATWTTARVRSRGAGHYAVAFTLPKRAQTNGFGALRVNAEDAVGGTFSQTILRAFAVAR